MDIADESSGTWERRADVDAVDADEDPCDVKPLVKCGCISIGDNRPDSDAGASKELTELPGRVSFSTFESPNEQNRKGFVRLERNR